MACEKHHRCRDAPAKFCGPFRSEQGGLQRASLLERGDLRLSGGASGNGYCNGPDRPVEQYDLLSRRRPSHSCRAGLVGIGYVWPDGQLCCVPGYSLAHPRCHGHYNCRDSPRDEHAKRFCSSPHCRSTRLFRISQSRDLAKEALKSRAESTSSIARSAPTLSAPMGIRRITLQP